MSENQLNNLTADPLWEVAMQCVFYGLAFGFGMGLTLWKRNERGFEKDADADDLV